MAEKNPKETRKDYECLEQVVGCKWSVSVLMAVKGGINRPGALEKAISGISTKILSERLRKLTAYELLSKKKFNETPPRTVYALTSKGERLVHIIAQLHELDGNNPALDGANSPASSEPGAPCHSPEHGFLAVGIAGPSGCGKSSLVRELAAHYGETQVCVLSLDRYYNDLSHLAAFERDKINFDDPSALEWELVSIQLEQLRAGQSIEAPDYNFKTHCRKTVATRISSKPIIIVEGLFTFCNQATTDLLDLKIFINVSAEECLRRRIMRDTAERGRSEESVRDQFEKHVLPSMRRTIMPSARQADLEIDGELSMGRIADLCIKAIDVKRSQQGHGKIPI